MCTFGRQTRTRKARLVLVVVVAAVLTSLKEREMDEHLVVPSARVGCRCKLNAAGKERERNSKRNGGTLCTALGLAAPKLVL